MDRLFVSFWHICLDNLPEGNFRRLRVPPGDARELIARARKDHALLCLSADDLLAPYHEHECENHRALCRVLNDHYEIHLSLDDFITKSDGDRDPSFLCNPLEVAKVQGRDRLLVVTCAYTLPKKEGRRTKRLGFVIETSTVEFHLIEACDSEYNT